MIRPTGPAPHNRLLYSSVLTMAAQGNGPLERQLCAVARRRQLSMQQKMVQNGQPEGQSLPHYPARPRPPG